MNAKACERKGGKWNHRTEKCTTGELYKLVVYNPSTKKWKTWQKGITEKERRESAGRMPLGVMIVEESYNPNKKHYLFEELEPEQQMYMLTGGIFGSVKPTKKKVIN